MEKITITSKNESVVSLYDATPFNYTNSETKLDRNWLVQLFVDLSHSFSSLFEKTEVLLKDTATTEVQEKQKPVKNRFIISEDIQLEIENKLNDFEKRKGFLNCEITLNTLARKLGTNHSYLSKVVNHTKGKSFKKYLNDLRIENAYLELRNNVQKRKYTVEAIAYDQGFRSPESFSKKFKETYQLYPSQFIKSLNSSEY